MPYLDPSLLEPYRRNRLLTMQTHPQYPHLQIWNYTAECQYSKAWDAVTRQCRGLILDTQREQVHAACLEKFFNLEEYQQQGWPVPEEMPLIFEKYDGWYAALSWIDDEPWISTRGSFMSPGAVAATAWFRQIIPSMTTREFDFWRNPDVTHLFEIIMPETRIVVQYDFAGLVWLCSLDRTTGRTVFTPTDEHFYAIRAAQRIHAADYTTLTQQPYANSEGFVVLFPQADVRVKLKFAEYVNLHRIYIGLSAHSIWKMLYDGSTVEAIVQALPDELQPWGTQVGTMIVDGVATRHETIAQVHTRTLAAIPQTWGDNKTARDKAMALALLATEEPFLLLYHKYRDALYKSIEPTGSETFRQEVADA